MADCKKKVLKPFRPIEVTEVGEKDTVKVWGREYTIEKSALPTSIISQGEELLSGPIRIVMEENGQASEWECKTNYLMSSDQAEAVICGIQQSDAFVINTAIKIEYDGLVDITLKVVPRGRTGAQLLGHVAPTDVKYDMNKLWVEIPLKREMAQLYQTSLTSSINFADESVPEDEVVRSSGKLATSMNMSFAPLISLNEGGAKGLSYYCESAENWQPEREDKAIELVVSEDEVILRLHLLDGHPHSWKQRGDAPLRTSYFPLTYEFGIMATPLKPYPENPYKRKILHLRGFQKGTTYDKYLATPSPEFGGMNAYDKMKEMGVTTLILHEAWNTTQNFWEIPVHRQSVVKNIIKECHARNIEFIPYFGYEISTLGAYWHKEKIDDIIRVVKDDEGWFGWYREPFQRDYIVCYRSDWKYTMIEGIQKLVDEYDIDGVYMDLGMSACQNENHGCGFHDHNGKLQPTYPIHALRELFRGLYSIFDPRGGMVNSHQGAKYVIPTRSFIHANYTGEEISWYIKDEGAEKVPLEYYNFTLSGQASGTTVDFVCEEYPPEWTFKDSYSITLLSGATPRARNFNQLEIAGPIWKIFDSFPMANATWHPYTRNDAIIESTDERVKVSFYMTTDIRGKKSLLAFVTNPTRNECGEVSVRFSDAFVKNPVAYDALNKCDLDMKDNTVTLPFGNFATHILLINEQ